MYNGLNSIQKMEIGWVKCNALLPTFRLMYIKWIYVIDAKWGIIALAIPGCTIYVSVSVCACGFTVFVAQNEMHVCNNKK